MVGAWFGALIGLHVFLLPQTAPALTPPTYNPPLHLANVAPTWTPAQEAPTPTPSEIPTIVIHVPTDAPTVESTLVLTSTAHSPASSPLPFDLDALESTVREFTQPLGGAFIAGMQLTAAIFILLGAIVLLRHNL